MKKFFSSFGMQRSVKPPAQRAPAAAPQRNATPATAPKSRSWLGIAGIAAELGLALFSHLRWAPAGFWAPFILSMMKRNSTATSDAGSIPADFDAEAFARDAKIQFIRLQAAHDAGNLDDIRAFTTPEVFAEIRMQMSEHQGEQSTTDVIDLAAEVLDVATEADRHIVIVRFHGNLREEREERDAPPAPFDEIWHMTKPLHGGSGWLIAGIQRKDNV